MRSFGAFFLMLGACALAPDHIEAEDAGLRADGGETTDGGSTADTGSSPDGGDAGTETDGGPLPSWRLTEVDGLLGSDDDAIVDTEGFQFRLTVNGPALSSFTLVLNEQFVAEGTTSADGDAVLTLELEHGDNRLSLVSNEVVEATATYSLDTEAPSGTVTLSEGRRAVLDWSAVNDDDGVGQDGLTTISLAIDDGEAELLDTAEPRKDLSHIAIGPHSVQLVLADEGGNRLTFDGTFDTGLRTNDEPIVAGPSPFRPCVGELDGLRGAELVFADRGGIVHFLSGSNLNLVNDLPQDEWVSRNQITDPIGCLIGDLDGNRRALIADRLLQVLGEDRYPQLAIATFNRRRVEIREQLRGDLNNLSHQVLHNLAFAPAMMGSDRPLDGVVVQRGPTFLRIFRSNRLANRAGRMSDFENEIDISLPAPLPPRHLINGDFNGDGSTDFLVALPTAAEGNGAIWVKSSPIADDMSHVLTDGNAAFTAAGNSGAVSLPTAIRYDDQPGQELIVTDSNNVLYVLSNLAGEGAAQAAALLSPQDLGQIHDLTACDLTGDDRDELIIAASSGLWLRSTDGTWTRLPYAHGVRTVVCDGDLSADGLMDLVVTDNSRWLSVLH